MAYKEISGNIFNTKAMAVVNTVNCVGAMGKGIALDFKLRFPEMFKEYQRICFQHLLKPGQILPYKKSNPIILNFAIKDDWKDPSKVEWIEETLQKFVDNYKKIRNNIHCISMDGSNEWWIANRNHQRFNKEISLKIRRY